MSLKSSKKKYDLIIMEVYCTDCLLGFTNVFKAPIIGISATKHLPWALDRMGNPDNPSYMSNYFVPWIGKMVFYQKLEITFMTLFTKLG